MIRIAVFAVLMLGFLVAVLFGCAGRFDLGFFWAYVACIAVVVAVGIRVMDPELRKERLRPGPGGCDRHLRIVVMPFFLAHLVVAGLDAGRFHWSDTVPTSLQAASLIVLALGYSLSLWSVSVNRFFSPVVRLQSDRGHRLVTDGPYRWIRHPGYLASIIMIPCGGMTLGSWWSLVPVIPVIVLILRRTVIENRFLHQQLEGYREYAARVRYRLVPGVW